MKRFLTLVFGLIGAFGIAQASGAHASSAGMTMRAVPAAAGSSSLNPLSSSPMAGRSSTLATWNAPVPRGSVTFQYDDGTYENAIGLTAGYATIYLNRFQATGPLTIASIAIDWPSTAGVDLTGNSINLLVYYDAGSTGDVTNAVRVGADSLITIGAIDTFESYPTSFAVPGAGDVYIGFETAYLIGAPQPGTFPGAIDTDGGTDQGYISGSSTGDPDVDNLGNNDTTGTIGGFGFPGVWMVRAVGTTGGGGGDDFTSTEVVPIPDDTYDGSLGSMACTDIDASSLPAADTVTGVSISTSITHTWIGDLTAKLVSPDGSILGVFSRPGYAEAADDGMGCCGSSADMDAASPVTFDDASANDAELMGTGLTSTQAVCAADGICDFAPNPDTVAVPPANFAGFAGETASGTWTLCVGDSGGGDTGSLEGWSINIGHGGGGGIDPVATVTPASLTFSVVEDATASDTLNIANAAGSDPLTFAIEGRDAAAPIVPMNNDRAPTAEEFAALSVREAGAGINGTACAGAIVPWLTATPASGSVPGGSDTDVTVSVNPTAGSLTPGDYNAELCITTNDPLQTLISIPVAVTVTAAPPPDGIFCSGFEDGEDGSCDNGMGGNMVPGPWSNGTTGPSARYRAGGTSDGDDAYVYGGGDSAGAFFADAWKWDAATDTWTQLADMPTGKQNIQGSYLDGKIYVPGGYNGVHIAENAIYDIGTDTWTTGAPLPVAHTGATAAYDGKIYDFGGNGGNTRLDIYDPVTDTWTQGADFPINITYGRAVTAGDYIYYVGGIADGATNSADVWRYDPASDSYTQMASLQTPRSSEELMADGDRIYAVNGGDDTFFAGIPLAQTVEIYDITADTWAYGEPTLTTAAGSAGGLAGGKLMIMGGVDSVTYYDQVQISTLVPE